MQSNLAYQPRSFPPMLQQYLEYKRNYPDTIIFFQVGDFYEVFFEDAALVAEKLNLTLTTRDKNEENPIPMCGVPISSIDGYLERLVSQGLSGALVSQLNTFSDGRPTLSLAKAQNAKRDTIQRKLTRVVTPGIKILSNVESGEFGVLASVILYSENEGAFAYTDVQSGIICAREGLSFLQIRDELAKVEVTEVLIPSLINDKKIDRRITWVRQLEQLVGEYSLKFKHQNSLAEALGNSNRINALPGYTGLGTWSRRAVQLLTSYLDEVTVEAKLPLKEIVNQEEKDTLVIDAATRDNLELVKNLKDGGVRGTVYGLMNHTVTIGGSRLLKRWILEPLTNLEKIKERQDFVECCKTELENRRGLRELLKGITDIERIASRLDLGVINPKELGALRDVFEKAPKIQTFLASFNTTSPLISSLVTQSTLTSNLINLLVNSLQDNPPFSLSEGGIFRHGYDSELDRLKTLREDSDNWLSEFETKERAKTGISSLKVKFNNVLGYFIEVTRPNISRIPAYYIRRQSTAQTERFTTEELSAREEEILSAGEKEKTRERFLFESLRDEVKKEVLQIRNIAHALSVLDVILCLAELAEREGYIRPEISESSVIKISDGKHPVLSKMLEGRFVPNSLDMLEDSRRCFVITGPNMGGKSTYLRQSALLVIMAQLGSFLPAKSAQIGIVDKIFARIGASDNLIEGESTFMVEMREAAHIIRAATKRSLILIDEIGRGTATSDGLAIAQAILEWVVDKTQARVLFATHFYELTTLDEDYKEVVNLSVGSFEEKDQVIFTHEMCEGKANRSYGIEVAKLAGLPSQVIDRAQEILACLITEQKPSQKMYKKEKTDSKPSSQLSLFGLNEREEELKQELKNIEINNITPLQAHQILSTIKEKWGKGVL